MTSCCCPIFQRLSVLHEKSKHEANVQLFRHSFVELAQVNADRS